MGKKDRDKEKKEAKQSKRQSAESGETQMKTIAMGVGGAVLTLYLSLILMFHGEGDIVYLSAAEPEALKAVFVSGEPWLVWCSDSSTEGEDIAEIHSVVTNAAPLLKRQATVGILDCNATLPSGKTTYDKVGIDPESKGPKLFLSANGQKPLQIKGKHTKTSEALAAHVAEKARPALRKPTNMEQLKSACLGRKWCGLVLTDGKPKGDIKDHLDKLVRRFRGISFSSIDAKKYRLSTTPKMLTKFEPKREQPTLLLLHKTKLKGKPTLLAKKYNAGDLDAEGGAGDLLEQALAVGTVDDKAKAKGWTKLATTPTLRYRKGASRFEKEQEEEDFELIEEGSDESSDDAEEEEPEETESGEEGKDEQDDTQDDKQAKEPKEPKEPKKPKGAKAERIAQLKRARLEKVAAKEAEAKADADTRAELQARAREKARRAAMDKEAERSTDFIEEADPDEAEQEDEEEEDEGEVIGGLDEDEDEDEDDGGDDEEVVLLEDWDDDEEL